MKELYALGCAVKCTDAGFIVSDKKEIILTSMFQRSFEDIAYHPSELACRLTESSKKYASLSPNPWHVKSGGHMVYTVLLIIFMDNVLGNISKQEQASCDLHVQCKPPIELMHAMKELVS
ncbi:hypothetical protein PAXRUDRAFT_19412 [Paxillus rubicundulus Ve08.2h10]|uniref:Uncharacterized protein n=1 Tax=Paxillus rubicundulus Ve08.2h10 TaxID=930991 RepID=A0A0D0CV25_9AGAM|nr:hypothetical protein PAXRUDRAFT_19412 [Paxillus rubicundulus Ve08.2h10]